MGIILLIVGLLLWILSPYTLVGVILMIVGGVLILVAASGNSRYW